jgi:hypothetical protein
MQLMETAKNELAAVYKDEEGAFWFKCYAISESQGGGYMMLIRLPLPTTEKLIDIAITSDHEDEMLAAVLRLLDEEVIEKKDFRLNLIERLEELASELEQPELKRRIVTIIKLSRLDDPLNKRDVLHKSASEIKKDADIFENISNRATALLSSLQ